MQSIQEQDEAKFEQAFMSFDKKEDLSNLSDEDETVSQQPHSETKN